MNAMEKMAISIISGLVPPEVMAMITPENIKQIADNLNSRFSEFEAKQNRILEILERLENDGRYCKPGSIGNGTDSNGTGDE